LKGEDIGSNEFHSLNYLVYLEKEKEIRVGLTSSQINLDNIADGLVKLLSLQNSHVSSFFVTFSTNFAVFK